MLIIFSIIVFLTLVVGIASAFGPSKSEELRRGNHAVNEVRPGSLLDLRSLEMNDRNDSSFLSPKEMSGFHNSAFNHGKKPRVETSHYYMHPNTIIPRVSPNPDSEAFWERSQYIDLSATDCQKTSETEKGIRKAA